VQNARRADAEEESVSEWRCANCDELLDKEEPSEKCPECGEPTDVESCSECGTKLTGVESERRQECERIAVSLGLSNPIRTAFDGTSVCTHCGAVYEADDNGETYSKHEDACLWVRARKVLP
jgi:hypothetical protein